MLRVEGSDMQGLWMTQCSGPVDDCPVLCMFSLKAQGLGLRAFLLLRSGFKILRYRTTAAQEKLTRQSVVAVSLKF